MDGGRWTDMGGGRWVAGGSEGWWGEVDGGKLTDGWMDAAMPEVLNK